MLGEAKVQGICKKVLQHCAQDQAFVLLMSTDSALTRFANNAIHQNVSESNAALTVRYIIGKQMGTASTNRLDDNALDQVVERARMNAQASPEDPDYPGQAQPAPYQSISAFDQATAEYSPGKRAQAVGVVCRLSQEKGLNASGAFSTGCNEMAVANSAGVMDYFSSTQADFQTVVMGSDASGRAQASDWRVGEIQTEMLGQEAIQKAELGRNPRKIEPGEYPVIFDPYVTQDLMDNLNFHGMGAQAVQEGRSWMSDRIGQQAMSPKISIWDDGLDLNGLPMPFDFEGVPKKHVDIVTDGVINGPVYDRYTAHKAGKTSTGHGLPPEARGMGPIAMNLFMAPGASTLEEMIRSTQRGLYITRFWYTRLVHPRQCVVTGMTRDGVFWIEDGQIAYPVKNLRFTQSYVQALNNVEAVGKDRRLLFAEFGSIAVRVPALKISAFNFTGSTV